MDSRALRWKNQGIVFLITLMTIYFFCTEPGEKLIKNIYTNTDNLKQLYPIVTIVIAFFGSAAIGYLINSFTVASVCIFRKREPGEWYTSEWEKNIQISFWNYLIKNAPNKNYDEFNPSVRLKEYSCDVILSYYWQQAPESLIKWVSRRHDVYWTNIAINYALGFGVGIFLVLWLTMLEIKITEFNLYRTIGTICIMLIVGRFNYLHARFARIEACNLIELWAFHKFKYKFNSDDNLAIKIYELLDIACDDCKSNPEDKTKDTPNVKIGKQTINKCINYMKEKENDKKDIT